MLLRPIIPLLTDAVNLLLELPGSQTEIKLFENNSLVYTWLSTSIKIKPAYLAEERTDENHLSNHLLARHSGSGKG